MNNSNSMYSEILLDYYRHPSNKGKLEKSAASAKDSNPLCGDELEITLNIEKGKIKEAKFDGKGCVISQASMSMLVEYLEGKLVKEALKIDKDQVLKMLGVKLTPIRLKCALLGLKVTKLALINYASKND